MSRSPHELLLQLRSLHERLSRRDLGQAVSNAALADVLVARSERALTASRLPVHSTPEQFLASAAARNSLATLLVVNRASASAAHDGVRAASEAWRAKEREREAAEQRRAAEQRETDDLSSARHRRDHGGAS